MLGAGERADSTQVHGPDTLCRLVRITNRYNSRRLKESLSGQTRRQRGIHTCNQLFYHCDTSPAEEENNKKENRRGERREKGAKEAEQESQ